LSQFPNWNGFLLPEVPWIPIEEFKLPIVNLKELMITTVFLSQSFFTDRLHGEFRK
jgi:hypothetical protein